jgi:parallel beta-helix repeat protein
LRRSVPVLLAFIALCFLSLLSLTGCGATGASATASSSTTTTSGGSGSTPSTPVAIAVALSPTSVALAAGQTQTFTATVTGAGNTQVTWKVNGFAGGNSTVGTINSSGVYTAPATVPTASVSVTAVSSSDSTKSASALVSFTQPAPPPPTIAVSVAPLVATLGGGQTQAFAATVTGTSNTQVNWLVNGISGGSGTLGTITSSGLYTAPATVPTSSVSITAVSSADSTKAGSATVGFSAPPLPGTNYYVSQSGNDANDGSQQSPWATIQHAAGVATAGAVVHVAPGTYSGAITTQTSGTATSRIRFISDVQWGALIRAASVYIVWTNLGNYVDIEGFDIAGNDAATCSGIINYASYVRIIGNNVHNLGYDDTTCVYGAGIVNHQNDAGHDDDVIGNVVHDIGNVNNTKQFLHGIYHANLRGHIWNNLVYRCEGWGIHLWHAANQVTIANNTVFNNGYGGIIIGDGDDTGGFPGPVVNDYTVVTNNIVYRNGLNSNASGYGIEEYGLTGTHNQYLNNLVYQNGPADWNLQNGNTAVASISADPQFVNYQPDGSGDYHLQSASPALAVGASLGAPPIDTTGAARSSTSPDLGIYQSNSSPGTWPYIQ